MKKTLIALAAVAATGAAFAQTVTLSGSLAYGYQSTTTNTAAVTASNGLLNTGVSQPAGYTLAAGESWVVDPVAAAAAGSSKASGFGVDTAALTFAVTEDLGGGLKLAGSMSLGGITRGDTPTGEDFKMVVSGGFGSLLLGQIEIGSGIRGLAQAGAPVNNMEGEILDPATAGTDIVKYTAPAMGGLTFSGSLTEAKGLANGLSKGQSSAVTVGVDYAAGPLKAKLDVTNWDSDSTKYDDRYRIAASYDLGVAKIGAGYDSNDNVGAGAGKTKFTQVGVSAPIGAFTVGATWVKKAVTGAASRDGYSIGASYALSKRTSIDANYARWDSAAVANTSDKKTTILLVHNF